MASPKRAFRRCTSSLSSGVGPSFGGGGAAGGLGGAAPAGAPGAAGFAGAAGFGGVAGVDGVAAAPSAGGFGGTEAPSAAGFGGSAGGLGAGVFSEGSLAIVSIGRSRQATTSEFAHRARAARLFNTPQKTASTHSDRYFGPARPSRARLCDRARYSRPAKFRERRAWSAAHIRQAGCI